MDSDCSLIPGDFLVKSTHIKTLGGGTFGSVSLYETPVGKLVVKETKIHNKSLGYPPDFLNEIDLLIKLKPLSSVVSIHSVCFNTTSRIGYILLEPLDANLSEWAKRTPFLKRIESLMSIIENIGGTLAIMHKFNLLHNDIKTNNILVKENEGNPIFKLADFGKSYYVIDENLKYGAIPNYSSPDKFLDLFSSEFWSFMVCLVEVILGGRKMIEGNPKSFYTKYSKITHRGVDFDLPRFLRENLRPEEFNKIPQDFWDFVKPIIRGNSVRISKALKNIGIELNKSVVEKVKNQISRISKIHPDYWSAEKPFKYRFMEIGVSIDSPTFEQFKNLLNKFLLSTEEPLSREEILKYGEVALIIAVKKKVSHLDYFKRQKDILLYERNFLMKIGYQIYILCTIS